MKHVSSMIHEPWTKDMNQWNIDKTTHNDQEQKMQI